MELKDYGLAIRRRWKIVVACLVLVVGAASLLTLQAVPQYESRAQLFVATKPARAGELVESASQRAASYAGLVNNRALAREVAMMLDGEFDVMTLVNQTTAEATPGGVSLDIIVTDPDPVAARDIAQAYAEALSAQVAILETRPDEDVAQATATITDGAVVPEDPVSPNPIRNLGLAFAFGLLLGLGLAVLRDLFDTSVRSAEDIGKVAMAPILGQINVDPKAARMAATQALSSSTAWAESVRVLRTNLQYIELETDAQVFLVSSPMPGEGKSTTSTNLAVSLAQAGRRVVLLECDLRNPTTAERLGLDGGSGMTDVLTGGASLDEALQGMDGTDLKVMVAGPVPPNPAELLQSLAMDEMISALRDRFDAVVMDAPPLLPVADAALLAARADGSLLVVGHGKTKRAQLTHALERLDSVGATCIGVVINLVPTTKTSAAYGYGYGLNNKTASSAKAVRPPTG